MLAIIAITWFVLQVAIAKMESPCYDVLNHCNSILLLGYAENCGKSLDLSDRVMGGKNAALGEFPWLARLFYRKGETVETLCSGSIINNNYILTAAHCCVGTQDMELSYVRLGDYDNRTDEDCYRGHCAPPHVDIEVEKIISHENYHPTELENDICLLRLRKRILFTEYKSPICIPTQCNFQRRNLNNETLVAAGWGALDDVGGRPRDVLQKLPARVISQRDCAKEWKQVGKELPPATICAGMTLGQDVCGGDSGGPLMFRAPNDKYYLSGLVSYGLPCSQRTRFMLPGVYTRITSFLEWILNNMEM